MMIFDSSPFNGASCGLQRAQTAYTGCGYTYLVRADRDHQCGGGGTTMVIFDSWVFDSGADIAVHDNYQLFRIPMSGSTLGDAIAACNAARPGSKPLGNYWGEGCGGKVAAFNSNAGIDGAERELFSASMWEQGDTLVGNYGGASCPGYDGNQWFKAGPGAGWSNTMAGRKLVCAAPGCPGSAEANINFYGEDCNCMTASPDGLTYQNGVASWAACSNLCVGYGSSHYTHRASDGRCWCKTSDRGRTTASGPNGAGFNSGRACNGPQWSTEFAEGTSSGGLGGDGGLAGLPAALPGGKVRLEWGSDYIEFKPAGNIFLSRPTSGNHRIVQLSHFSTSDARLSSWVANAGGAVFCIAATDQWDSAWAIKPKDDTAYGIGCNSGSWQGRGAFYGDDHYGAGWVGVKDNGEPKAIVGSSTNLGLSVKEVGPGTGGGVPQARGTDVCVSRPTGVVTPAASEQECGDTLLVGGGHRLSADLREIGECRQDTGSDLHSFDENNDATNTFIKCEAKCAETSGCNSFAFGTLGAGRQRDCILRSQTHFCDANMGWGYYTMRSGTGSLLESSSSSSKRSPTRIPVPNAGACDWGLAAAGIAQSCAVCDQYYDGRASNVHSKECVWIPAEGQCFPRDWAESSNPPMVIEACGSVAYVRSEADWTNSCPAGSVDIESASECQQAVSSIAAGAPCAGCPPELYWQSEMNAFSKPRGCSHGSNGAVRFNTHHTGAGKRRMWKLCKSPSAAGPAAQGTRAGQRWAGPARAGRRTGTSPR
jgi:hypothetical protein